MPIANIKVENGTIMILEAVEEVERDTKSGGKSVMRWPGFIKPNPICMALKLTLTEGDIYQDNQPSTDWVSFYRDRRLLPRLKMAIDSGHLSRSVAKQHGDAHHNNFLSTSRGAVMIDPAVHHGHPELDCRIWTCFRRSQPRFSMDTEKRRRSTWASPKGGTYSAFPPG